MVWVPQEHGAWAWLLIPIAVGVLVSGPAWFQAALLVSALAGYFFFNAASWWAKMPPNRRGAARAPMLVYGTVAGLSVVAVVALTTPSVLLWFGLQALCLLLAWFYTRRGAARSLGSGLATALSSSVLVMIAAQPNPLVLPTPDELWAGFFTFGYLAGTIFTVKSVVRERGSIAWFIASVGWHVGWAAISVVAIFTGQTLMWLVLWIALSARAAALAAWARRAPVRPSVVGTLEVVASAAFLAVVAWAAR